MKNKKLNELSTQITRNILTELANSENFILKKYNESKNINIRSDETMNENKKTARITFAIAEQNKEIIRNKSKEMKISMSEYIRYKLYDNTDLKIDMINQRFDKLEQMIFNLSNHSINQTDYETMRPPKIPKRIITKKETIIKINFRAVITELKEKFETNNNILKPIEIEA